MTQANSPNFNYASHSGPLLPKFDPLVIKGLDDPYPEYQRLRALGPLLRGGPGQYVVTRYKDVVSLMRSPHLGSEFPEEFHSFSVGTGPTRSFFQNIILDRDPPKHTRLRRLMGPAFSVSSLDALRPKMLAMIDSLFDRMLEEKEVDVVEALAYPLPIAVLCELIGVPDPDREAVRPRALALADAFALTVPMSARKRADDAIQWLRDYLGELLKQRRRAPGSDLMSQIATTVTGEDALSVEEAVDNAIFLFFAGFETTTNLIASGMHCLCRFPEQAEKLWQRPALSGSAVEEFLRFDGPIQVKARLAKKDLTVGEHRIPQGRILVLLLGSANHDEAQFECADQVLLDRSPNAHVSFGGGAHSCLGAAMARLEGRAVFEALVKRVAGLERAGEMRRRSSASFRAVECLPVRMRAR